MNTFRLNRYFSLCLVLSLSLPLFARGHSAEHTERVSINELNEVVNALIERLEESYIFPEVSHQIKTTIGARLANSEYNAYLDGKELAERLTRDIQAISHDVHLKVYFDPVAVRSMSNVLSQEEQKRVDIEELKKQRSKNFGFKQVSILEGNIGYIDLRSFAFPEEAIETLIASMNFVQNTHSMIFDLRNNRGGSPSMVQLIISYFLEKEPILLNDIYKKPINLTKQYWSLPFVPGKRRPDVDLYVLISSGTFSAAEDFSYTLKHLNRATIIGETTGGGAHAGGKEPITERFLVWVPTSRTINPITKSNWEGQGVKPHVNVKAENALQHAHILALEMQLTKGIGDNRINQWYFEHQTANKHQYAISDELKQKYAGNYGLRTLIYENGNLYYQRKGDRPLRLTPMSNTLFLVEGKAHFRIKIIEKDGKVTAIQGITDTGSVSQNTREMI